MKTCSLLSAPRVHHAVAGLRLDPIDRSLRRATRPRFPRAKITRLDGTSIDTTALTQGIEALTRAAHVHGLTVTIFNRAERVYSRAFGFADLPSREAAPHRHRDVRRVAQQGGLHRAGHEARRTGRARPRQATSRLRERAAVAEPRHHLARRPERPPHRPALPAHHGAHVPEPHQRPARLALVRAGPEAADPLRARREVLLLRRRNDSLAGGHREGDRPVTRTTDAGACVRTVRHAHVELHVAAAVRERTTPSATRRTARCTQRTKTMRPARPARCETTTDDYARFMGAVLRGEGLRSASWNEMFKAQVRIRTRTQFGPGAAETTSVNDAIELSYGLGWGLQRTPYGWGAFKEGHGDGFQHYSIVYPAKRLGLLLMSNSDNAREHLQSPARADDRRLVHAAGVGELCAV